ncbi:MAG: hypothetical protein H6974_16205 [Gammaproteobacteria bacterium]|jgi:hypothetical protein|nr:hypothetical protein [Gammaproteobacteria bacterium]
MSIRNTPERNRIAAAKRRERLREAGYRVLHAEIPGLLFERIHAVAHARKMTIAAAVTEALDAWARTNEEQHQPGKK